MFSTAIVCITTDKKLFHKRDIHSTKENEEMHGLQTWGGERAIKLLPPWTRQSGIWGQTVQTAALTPETQHWGWHEHAGLDLANTLGPITYPQKKNLLAPLSNKNLKTTKSNKQKKTKQDFFPWVLNLWKQCTPIIKKKWNIYNC